MKKPTAPKFNQLEFLEKLSKTQSNIYTLLMRTVERCDKLEAAVAAPPFQAPQLLTPLPDPLRFEKHAHNYGLGPEATVRPAPLVWKEWCTTPILWGIGEDPRKFAALKPGDLLKVNTYGEVTWRGLALGDVGQNIVTNILRIQNTGGKIHAFFRSTGEVTIKVGRPQ